MPIEPSVVWTSGTQFHFYDDPTTIEYAVRQAVAHSRETLLTPALSESES